MMKIVVDEFAEGSESFILLRYACGVGSTPPAGVVGASIQHYSVVRGLIRPNLDSTVLFVREVTF